MMPAQPPGSRAADIARAPAVAPTDVGAEPGGPLQLRHAGGPEILAGRYRIIRELGTGGMGMVDLAHDMRLDRHVAIKRVRDLWLEDAEARRRLLREGRALAGLSHPSIAGVQDVIDTSPPALVMEYVEGEPLSEWIQVPRAPSDVVAVIRQVAEAVAYAHAKGVVHCDLKPRNVLVTPDTRAKVVDFGIALVLSRLTTTVVGDTTRRPAFTPKFAAPEVVRGATPSPAADVFSMGVLIDDVLAVDAPPGHPWPRGVMTTLRGVALRARSDAPEDRFPDGAALLAMLPAAPPTRGSRRHYWWTRIATATIAIPTCLSLMGDTDASLRAAVLGPRVLAVTTRVDEASAGTMSAAAADILRRALGPLEKSRLVAGEVPPLTSDMSALVEALRFEGLTHVLVPTVSPIGPDVKVSVALLRARDGTVLVTATRTGSPDELETLTRNVADELREWLGEAKRQQPASLPQLSVRSAAEYSEARRYLERPDRANVLTHARSLLESVTRRDATYAPAFAELSRVLILQYDERPDPVLLVQARNAADRAILLQPTLPEARVALANVFTATGRPADANAELQRAIAADPGNEQALRLLARNEAEQGHVEEGIAILRKLIGLRESWVNYRALGTLYWDDGRNEEALGHFRQLTHLQPDNPWGYQMLGTAHLQLGQVDDAVSAFERSIAIRPTARALTNLATIHYSRNDMAVAERLYAEAARLDPADPVLHRNLGDAQLARGRRPDARATYARAVAAAEALLAVNDTDVQARGNAAYSAARQGACEVAMRHAAALEPQAGRRRAPLANLANAYAICEQFPQARGALQRLVGGGARPEAYLERDVLDQLRRRSEFVPLLAAK